MTIVATIHSPTPFCFNLFDRLMILIGGYAIYHGPNGEHKMSLVAMLGFESSFNTTSFGLVGMQHHKLLSLPVRKAVMLQLGLA